MAMYSKSTSKNKKDDQLKGHWIRQFTMSKVCFCSGRFQIGKIMKIIQKKNIFGGRIALYLPQDLDLPNSLIFVNMVTIWIGQHLPLWSGNDRGGGCGWRWHRQLWGVCRHDLQYCEFRSMPFLNIFELIIYILFQNFGTPSFEDKKSPLENKNKDGKDGDYPFINTIT